MCFAFVAIVCNQGYLVSHTSLPVTTTLVSQMSLVGRRRRRRQALDTKGRIAHGTRQWDAGGCIFLCIEEPAFDLEHLRKPGLPTEAVKMMPESQEMTLGDVRYYGTEPGRIAVSVLFRQQKGVGRRRVQHSLTVGCTRSC